MKQTGLTFSELPPEYKKALVELRIMNFEGEDEDENIELLNGFYKDNRTTFTIENITPEEAKKRCMENADSEFLSIYKKFDEYHCYYIADGEDIPNHGESMYPVVEFGMEGQEWLIDGWHRFHSYIYYKKPFIPVLIIE